MEDKRLKHNKKTGEYFINQKELSKDLEKLWWVEHKHKFTYWNKKFTYDKKSFKYNKISLCTNVMDRLYDLKQTLPQNIKDNSDYPYVEFVILDYNSKKDNPGGWIKNNYIDMIKSGEMIFLQEKEAINYSMSHSRNINFKMATGDIVINIDADGYTNKGFCTFLNRLANEQPKRAIFTKGKSMTRGRLGFYKKEFINLLGGYDENMEGYGHDDKDLMYRAWQLGFKMMWFGGDYYRAVDGHKKHQSTNYKRSWKITESRNKLISVINLIVGNLKANQNHHWGKAKIKRNFDEWIEI